MYFLSMFNMLGHFKDILKKIQINFLWSRNEEKMKMSLVSWDQDCKPETQVGLNLREMGDINKALITNIRWKLSKN